MTVPQTKQNSGGPAAQGQTPALKTIAGVLERVTFQNQETGFTIARLAPEHSRPGQTPNKSPEISPRSTAAKGDDNLVTVVGAMVGVAVGEVLELKGLWQHNSQYGWQFKVESYRSVMPATTQGIRKYLGSGLIKGIGPRTAEKIVEHFGTETLDILESTPERLGEVPKLGNHRAGLIAAAWVEQRAIKEVMVFLQDLGVSTSLAVRIYKEYKDACSYYCEKRALPAGQRGLGDRF